MYKQFREFMRRVPRLWMWTGSMVMALSLGMIGMMQGIKLLDLPGCMALYLSSGSDSVELDLSTGRYIHNGPLRTGQLSHDGTHFIFTEPEAKDSLRIIVTNEGGEMVTLQEGVANIPNWQWETYIRWSHDGQQVAYIWAAQDRNIYLSIANADGSAKRTTPIPISEDSTTRSGIPSLVGWSSDDAYLAVATDLYGRTRSTKFTFWSVQDLQPLSGEVEYAVIRSTAAWSPVGHQFAVMALENDQAPTLFVMTPEGEPHAIPLSDPEITYFNWSPDGRYLLFAGLKLFQPSPRESARKWVYHLYSRAGELLYPSIIGKRIRSNETYSLPVFLNGLWSSDGDEWWFLQERVQGGARKIDLVALNLATGLNRLMALDIPPEFAETIFFTSTSQLFTVTTNSPENLRVSNSPHVLVPSRRGGKLVVDLLETATHRRTTLVEGAERLIDTRTSADYDVLFRSWNGVAIVIPWSAGEQAYLTLTDPDGSSIYTFDGGLQDIAQLRWGDGEWIGYLGRRGDTWSVELINRRTYQHRRLIDGLDQVGPWELLVQPDFAQAAVMLRENAGSEINELYLSPMDAQQVQQISPKIRNFPQWSPDGMRLAYLTTSENTIDIVSNEGEFLRQVAIPRPLRYPSWLGGWTGCEMRSP
jgi:Tol biopolymer transport system component